MNFLFKTRKRAREEEIEAAEKAKREREWQKNFEVRSSSVFSFILITLHATPHILLIINYVVTFGRNQEMGVWIVGGPSSPKGKPRRKRAGPSLNPPKLRWSRENDAVKLSIEIKIHFVCILTLFVVRCVVSHRDMCMTSYFS